jgi:hypothetical protein
MVLQVLLLLLLLFLRLMSPISSSSSQAWEMTQWWSWCVPHGTWDGRGQLCWAGCLRGLIAGGHDVLRSSDATNTAYCMQILISTQGFNAESNGAAAVAVDDGSPQQPRYNKMSGVHCTACTQHVH